MCDGWYDDEHEYDGVLVQVEDFKLCPDCLAEYRQDKYEQDEFGTMALEDQFDALLA